MWGRVKDRQSYLNRAIEFTGNHVLYGQWMMRVIEEWPNTCEHNLTNKTINRKAWIGHAAVAMAIQCPEDIVRAAWGFLSQEQRELANEQARLAIEEWERRHEEIVGNDGSGSLEDEDILGF